MTLREPEWEREEERKKLWDWAFSVLLDKNSNFHVKATVFSDMLLEERYRIKP